MRKLVTRAALAVMLAPLAFGLVRAVVKRGRK